MPLIHSIDEIFDLTKIEKQFQKIFELAMPFLNTRQNLPHTYIVYQYALLILQKEGGWRDVILPACILHDVGWSRIPEDQQLKAFGPLMTDFQSRRKHEVEGVLIAKQILSQVGYNGPLVRKVIDIIDGHDTRAKALSLEDAITKESDKLFRLSASGFKIDYERFQVDPESYLTHLSKKIDEWFLTRTGKELALQETRARHQEIRERQHSDFHGGGNRT
jgi:HD superfamily phosphodiesterase